METLLSSSYLLAQRGAACGRSAVGKDRVGEREQGQVSEGLVSHANWILLLVHKIGNFLYRSDFDLIYIFSDFFFFILILNVSLLY